MYIETLFSAAFYMIDLKENSNPHWGKRRFFIVIGTYTILYFVYIEIKIKVETS
jgi:hypothetical protein